MFYRSPCMRGISRRAKPRFLATSASRRRYGSDPATHGCVPCPLHIIDQPPKPKPNPLACPSRRSPSTLASRLMSCESGKIRYGWPRPDRQSNGYRCYPLSLVAILERVRDEIKRGKVIGDLMRDRWWQQVFDAGRFPEPTVRARTEPPWTALPKPSSTAGRDVSARLQHALVFGDLRLARGAMAMGERLRPEERECSVTAVLRMWHQHQT